MILTQPPHAVKRAPVWWAPLYTPHTPLYEKTKGDIDPVAWPAFPGLCGLSIRRDVNIGITSWSSFRCRNGHYLLTLCKVLLSKWLHMPAGNESQYLELCSLRVNCTCEWAIEFHKVGALTYALNLCLHACSFCLFIFSVLNWAHIKSRF